MTIHPVPLAMLEEFHVLEVGTTGSGKTYLLRGLLEQLRAADRRVGAIDKLGNHWGLTLAADGQSPGQEWIIFGGRRAHVPMAPADGAKLGRLFVERSVPAIFDVSQWKAFEREMFVADFADAVFEANYDRGPLHLSFDEAQSWAPQGAAAASTASIRRLVEQGRGNGVLTILAVQRLARLDITVRNLCQGVIALRQTGVADRRGLVDLMGADIPDAKAFDAELPRLKTGEGFVWDPGAGALARARFPANATFDSSRTPKHGEIAPAPVAAMSELVEQLRAALAPPTSDPSIPADASEAYRVETAAGEMLVERDREIAALKARLAQAEAAQQVAVSIGHRAHLALLDLGNTALREVHALNGELRADLQLPDANLQSGDANSHDPKTLAVPSPISGGEVVADAGGEQPASAAIRGRKALLALAAAHPGWLTEPQWALASGFSRKGGTWRTYRQQLVAAELVEQVDGKWRSTIAGLAAAGGVAAPLPPPGPELARFWSARISGARKMVELLIARWPHLTTLEALAADLGMTATGGTFRTYVSRLRGQELLEERGKRLRLSPAVMGDPA